MAELVDVCGCGHPHIAGTVACYVCELPLCLHPGDGCAYACECGCGDCEALQARLRGDLDDWWAEPQRDEIWEHERGF